MADEKQPGPGLGSSSIILFVAALASAVYVGWQAPPLVSSRPIDADHHVHETAGTQDTEARLWQDPLDAVMQAVEDGPNGGAPSQHSCENLFRPLEDHPALVLAVALPGAPYPEAAETRRRLRYAVLAALHAANYAPEDEKHIGYWRTEKILAQKPDDKKEPDAASPDAVSRDAVSKAAARIGTAAAPADGAAEIECLARETDSLARLPPYIPFEWFDEGMNLGVGPIPRTPNPGRRAAVLWLDEDFLTAGHRPVAALDRLVRELQRVNRTARRDIKFALIGPQDSTMLMEMAKDVARQQRSNRAVAGRCAFELSAQGMRYTVYNFGATAEDQKILSNSGSSETGIEAHFRSVGIRYFRTVSSDNSLAEVLIQELGRRDVHLCENSAVHPHRDHIALISERDTVYGRFLHSSVWEAFKKKAGEDVTKLSGFPDWIESYSYLRGLDGRLPDRKSIKNGNSSEDRNSEQNPNKPISATPDNTQKFEAAEGQSQFDYLRRLAATIKERDEELRRSGERIAAVGILGSDVYDKLLILQALRPEVPEALFFTTDLDALLLPQEKSRYTRNLLVASSYGLSLHRQLQDDIPPFRSTYQSSIFLATRLALRNEWSGTALDQQALNDKLTSWLASPVLFQIGRRAARMLPSGPEDASAQRLRADMIDYPSVQPEVVELYPPVGGRALVGAGFLLTGLLLAAVFGSRTVRRHCFPRMARAGDHPPAVRPRLNWLILSFLTAATVSAGLCFAWLRIGPFLTQGRLGEPMTLFQGISVWPTIAIRALGFGLSLWLICYALQSLKKNRRDTAQQMGFSSTQATFAQQRRELGPRKGGIISWWTTILIAQLWLPPKTPQQGGRPRKWLNQINGGSAASLPARFIRATVGTASMALVWSLILVPIFGDLNAPARGSLARIIYSSVTIADVFATLFLIFLVADATLYLAVFVKRLTSVETAWPPETINQFSHRFQMKAADLDDWLDMKFLAKRTHCITQLIYFPFLSLALLIVSRSRLFDDFSMPWTLIIAQAISLAVIIGSVVALRAAAENARAVARDNLTAKIIAAQGHKNTASQLQMILNEIENLKEGAFAPWSSQPIVKAVLLPLLSYGGTMLVHLYALPGT